VQDAATDCSVVASLCALVARGERGHAKVCVLDSKAIFDVADSSPDPRLHDVSL
jgi:hypothetical protein